MTVQESGDLRRGPLLPGDKVQLTDPKGRMHTLVLRPGESFHTEKGVIAHDDLLGGPEGVIATTSGGVDYQVLRPLYEDFVLSMPRGAAVVYPKDAALVVTLGDIFPGARVVEAGVGSGALTLALLRAAGPTGEVLSFEKRPEFAEVARGNIRDFFGQVPESWSCTIGDLAEALPETCAEASVDRVVLDMLAPWECLPAVTTALVPGGVFIAYVATATQLSRTVEALRASADFTEPQALESMVRGWHLEGLAVRPQHRMIGHTGFLVFARRLASGTRPLQRKKRPQGNTASAEDRAHWEDGEITDHAIGHRYASGKKLRRILREAGSAAATREAHHDQHTDVPVPESEDDS